MRLISFSVITYTLVLSALDSTLPLADMRPRREPDALTRATGARFSTAPSP